MAQRSPLTDRARAISTARQGSLADLRVRSLSTHKPFSVHGMMKRASLSKIDAELPPEEAKRLIDQRDNAIQNSHKAVKEFVENEAKWVLETLGTNQKLGLSAQEAAERLLKAGPNELEKEEPTPLWRMFLAQFEDLLVIMLIVASIVSGALGQLPACVAIIVIVLGNAILGFVQEFRAGEALDALQSITKTMAIVIRDERKQEVQSADLVPGDIVILENGPIVPADLRLLVAKDLQSLEVSLTGEPEGVNKNARAVNENSGHDDEHGEKALTDPNMVYMGCQIVNGSGVGVVVKTGMNTAMGAINEKMNEAKREKDSQSPLQKKLEALGVRLGYASILVSLIVFIIGVTTERGADPESDEAVWLQMLLAAVSLTVAAVPEGLPACVTITLAIGMNRMVQKNAIIKNLASVETLGSASCICSDKTGTLTKAEMTAVRVWHAHSLYRVTGTGYEPKGSIVPASCTANETEALEAAHDEIKGGSHEAVVLASALCSNATITFDQDTKEWKALGNTSESPLVVMAKKAEMDTKDLEKKFPRIAENPFSSKRKMMSVVVENDKWSKEDFKFTPFGQASKVAIVKGAPNFIVDRALSIQNADGSLSECDEKIKSELLEVVDDLSSQAFRVLAIGYQDMDEAKECDSDACEKDLVLLGFVASIDPERQEVIPSIEKAHGAGIRVVMITGDYVKTAKAIAINVHILSNNAPEGAAVDCQVLRDITDEFGPIEREWKSSETSKARKVELAPIVDAAYEKIDAITAVANVYARAKPTDKITIVNSLKRQGHICSMTGDGVNDAPALTAADIGVAMGITGTGVAKEAAAMILTDDNFVSIVEAVEEGRTIYNNIGKFVFYLLSTNVAEVFLMLFSSFIGLQFPLTPIQILWLNLTTDGAPAVALAVEPTEPGVMRQGPRLPTEPLIEKVMIRGICIHTVVLTGLCLFTYMLGLKWTIGDWRGEGSTSSDDHDIARTMTIYFIVFAELGRAYTSRSLRTSVFTLVQNKYQHYAVGSAVIGTLAVGHIPGLKDVFDLAYLDEARFWVYLLGTCMIPAIVDELNKAWYRHTKFGERPLARRIVARQKSMAALDVVDKKDNSSDDEIEMSSI